MALWGRKYGWCAPRGMSLAQGCGEWVASSSEASQVSNPSFAFRVVKRWINDVTSLSLYFFNYKTDLVTPKTSQGLLSI